MTNIQKCMPMTDHFEGIDKLVKEAPHTDGAPNFRRVSDWADQPEKVQGEPGGRGRLLGFTWLPFLSTFHGLPVSAWALEIGQNWLVYLARQSWNAQIKVNQTQITDHHPHPVHKCSQGRITTALKKLLFFSCLDSLVSAPARQPWRVSTSAWSRSRRSTATRSSSTGSTWGRSPSSTSTENPSLPESQKSKAFRLEVLWSETGVRFSAFWRFQIRIQSIQWNHDTSNFAIFEKRVLTSLQ